ncbi:MAG: hypothetical protein IRY85_09255 [Micromonosporaceae bacterium]|nr:hypothetical protein [Micromonosporaceae bacterium]
MGLPQRATAAFQETFVVRSGGAAREPDPEIPDIGRNDAGRFYQAEEAR